MPKLKIEEQEQRNCIVRAVIKGNQELHCLSKEELARAAGFTPRTWGNKMESPDTFTLEELQRAGKKLKLTPIQAASIVLGRPITSKEVKEFILL